ncbi:hypothetical protein IFM89_026505 [Coptis chinensis]|uniref:Uncharacterized protein n=1 Tax=Coptis chinensis TaxID=261450 RepID=A0A835LRM4_9MAGN|nr:hypothetical protein IFM89_026505 [Coptis chinensis]
MTHCENAKSSRKKLKKAKKEKAVMHDVMPTNTSRVEAKKGKAVMYDDKPTNTSRVESSKQGMKRIEKEKASIYAALTRNENGGVRFIDSTTKGSNQGTRNAEKGKASLYVERGSEINGACKSDSLANPVAIVKHYDKYDNDDERKRHRPKGVKRRLGQARINAIIEDDPSSIDLDLDNDPVAQVCGPDQYGRGAWYGCWCVKTSLIASVPAKEKLHQETQQRTMVEERVGTIEKHMITPPKLDGNKRSMYKERCC